MGGDLVPVDYAFKKGIDVPTWVWLTQCPVSSTVSASTKYDGSRYIYVAQSASLYRFDTWTNGWQNLGIPTTGGAGQDLVFDPVRNLVIIVHGLNLTSWQVFNLNTVAQTICGVVCQPFVFTTMTPVLPTPAASGSVLSMPRNVADADTVLTGLVAAAAGNTVTNVAATTTLPRFYAQLVGHEIRVLTGAQAGQRRMISAVINADNVTVVPALAGALASDDIFVIEQPKGTATAGAVGALTDTGKTWIVNKYSNFDVEITAGTGVGQRRRIASNTATVLTLAAAVTGNARTGNFGLAPDATSVYRIIPSTDWLYFGSGTTFYKLDVVANPAAVWTAITAAPGALGAGAGMDFSRGVAHGTLFVLRGGVSSNILTYDIGLGTWLTLAGLPAMVLTTGSAMVLVPGKGKLLFLRDLTTQVYALDLATMVWDSFSNHPYLAGTSLEGKRLEIATTPDGALMLYLLRAGGQEWFRLPVEWL